MNGTVMKAARKHEAIECAQRAHPGTEQGQVWELCIEDGKVYGWLVMRWKSHVASLGEKLGVDLLPVFVQYTGGDRAQGETEYQTIIPVEV